jgi:hypothetical protein
MEFDLHHERGFPVRLAFGAHVRSSEERTIRPIGCAKGPVRRYTTVAGEMESMLSRPTLVRTTCTNSSVPRTKRSVPLLLRRLRRREQLETN